MKKLIILTIFLSFISCEQKQDDQIKKNIEKTILKLERQGLDNWSKGDPLGYSVNFSKDVTYMDDIGAQLRLKGLENVQNYLKSLDGKIPPHRYKIVDPHVQVYEECSILTFQYHGSSEEGEPGPPWKATIVYRFNNGSWNVEHANWSLVKKTKKIIKE